jgi:hypothetical protein
MSKGRSLKEGEVDSVCDIVAFKISKGEGLGSKELYINGVCAFRQKKKNLHLKAFMSRIRWYNTATV